MAQTFDERLLDVLNSASLALMISIGHRTRLFDTMSDSGHATSEAIARRAGLDERYVREWLGALVSGRIVDYDATARTYALPAAHAAFLTRAAAPNNIGAFMQYVGLLGSVEDRIVECFHRGGGVDYAEFKRFHEVMAEDSGQTVLPVLIEQILPLAPGVVDALGRGIDVLDLGCGAGRALLRMAGAFPKSRFHGVDLSEEAIATARDGARRRQVANADFQVQDAARLDARDAYDLITTFDAIHDQADPARVLGNIQRALRRDGTYLMQDIAGTSRLEKDVELPAAPFLYAVSTMHCMTVSLAQGGAGLGTMWGEETARRMLREAGFTRVTIERLAHDFQNVYFVVRKD